MMFLCQNSDIIGNLLLYYPSREALMHLEVGVDN